MRLIPPPATRAFSAGCPPSTAGPPPPWTPSSFPTGNRLASRNADHRGTGSRSCTGRDPNRRSRRRANHPAVATEQPRPALRRGVPASHHTIGQGWTDFGAFHLMCEEMLAIDAARRAVQAERDTLSPVATTTASAIPAVTRVPPCSNDRRSASPAAALTGSAALSTGTDSPVSAASSARAPAGSSGPRRPARRPRATRHPRHEGLPRRPGSTARRTAPSPAPCCASAWIALPARYSWANPMSALSTTTASTTGPSGTSPNANATATEARST